MSLTNVLDTFNTWRATRLITNDKLSPTMPAARLLLPTIVTERLSDDASDEYLQPTFEIIFERIASTLHYIIGSKPLGGVDGESKAKGNIASHETAIIAGAPVLSIAHDIYDGDITDVAAALPTRLPTFFIAILTRRVGVADIPALLLDVGIATLAVLVVPTIIVVRASALVFCSCILRLIGFVLLFLLLAFSTTATTTTADPTSDAAIPSALPLALVVAALLPVEALVPARLLIAGVA